MATLPTTTIAISQMQYLNRLERDAVVPVVFGGNNYRMAISQILDGITKDSIGLGKVQNLSPDEMPISTAQQAALDQKLGRNDPIQQFQVANLEQDLANKLGRGDQIPQSQVTGLTQTIYELQNGPIPVTRVEGFSGAVQQIIDQQPTPDDQVIQGAHMW